MMSELTKGLPRHDANPDFGRAYPAAGDTVRTFRLPSGWWIMPSVLGGVMGWIVLIVAIFV